MIQPSPAFIVTRLSWRVFVARVMNLDDVTYNHGTVIKTGLLGRYSSKLCLYLWMGKSPAPQAWREGAAQYFPRAREVRFTRRGTDGEREAVVRLTPALTWRSVVRWLRR